MNISKGLLCALLGIALWSGVMPAEAIPLRIATWNVLHGIDTDHDHATNPNEDYAAATIETATGALIRVACSWNPPAGCGPSMVQLFVAIGSRTELTARSRSRSTSHAGRLAVTAC